MGDGVMGVINKKQDEALGKALEGIEAVMAGELDNFHKFIGVRMMFTACEVVLTSSQFHNRNCECLLCSTESKVYGLGGVDV